MVSICELASVQQVGYCHFACFTGHVTTLAGGSQGYKDGTGQDAKFHHTAGKAAKQPVLVYGKLRYR